MLRELEGQESCPRVDRGEKSVIPGRTENCSSTKRIAGLDLSSLLAGLGPQRAIRHMMMMKILSIP